MFGLKNSDIEFIKNTARKFIDIDAIGIYGSRAREDFKQNSDIDIIVYGDISLINLSELMDILEEQSPYPFFVDVKCYNKLEDSLFKDEVDRDVKIIYKR